jgi:sigma-B regulation protein RsbU (phosphoserine phosphatase)
MFHKGCAALFMALTFSLINTEARRSPSPCDVLSTVNQYLLSMNESGMFVTVLYGILDRLTREFWYARAGHDKPIADADGQPLEHRWRPGNLGVLPARLWMKSHRPAGGRPLLVFTDGATEAMDADGRMFGRERLQTALRANHAGGAQMLCAEIWRAVQTFSGDQPMHDDVTLVAVKLE